MKDNRAKKLDRLVRQYRIAGDDCHSFIDRLKQHVANYNDAILANGVELVGERFDELDDTVEAIVAVAQGSVPIVGDDDYPKWTPLLDSLSDGEQDAIMRRLAKDIGDVEEVIYYVECDYRPINCLVVCRDKRNNWYCRRLELNKDDGFTCGYDDCGSTKFSVIGIYGLMKLHDWISNSMMATHLKTEGYLAEYLK